MGVCYQSSLVSSNRSVWKDFRLKISNHKNSRFSCKNRPEHMYHVWGTLPNAVRLPAIGTIIFAKIFFKNIKSYTFVYFLCKNRMEHTPHRRVSLLKAVGPPNFFRLDRFSVEYIKLYKFKSVRCRKLYSPNNRTLPEKNVWNQHWF